MSTAETTSTLIARANLSKPHDALFAPNTVRNFVVWLEVHSEGRWISPDPAGIGAVSLSNPQSWNQYGYVVNNPLALVDPLGLDWLGNCLARFAANVCYDIMMDAGFSWSDVNAMFPGDGGAGRGGGGGLTRTCYVSERERTKVCDWLIGTGWTPTPPIPTGAGKVGAEANNGQPGVPKPPNPILKYDKCASQVRGQASKNKWTITVIQQVSFGNQIAACGFTGPDAPFCIGVVGGLNLLVSGVNFAGTQVAVWNGETACMQQP